ncbi:hypothetical protein BLA14095_03699 [Burkholderia lata]|uniref:hypothetical protein n=1 Tax=Burkholderia lata (strain ATCC 17760 / DSM 23089 / LMG 22485 / NCIMB 9086 / R18194 / 383) TaxID=482957 RepID=UPI00145334EB|nr:hypothetical protein [Burkholderia lata]VWB80148.1 hypothetical protein BLA14095_03699 [Burkholderia lata]
MPTLINRWDARSKGGITMRGAVAGSSFTFDPLEVFDTITKIVHNLSAITANTRNKKIGLPSHRDLSIGNAQDEADKSGDA